MRPYLGAALTLTVFAAAAAAQDAPRLFTTPTVPSRSALDGLNLRLAWRGYLPPESRRDGIFSVQLFEDIVVVRQRSGILTTLDATTGAVLWRARPGDPYPLIFPAGANDRYVIVTAGTRMYALNRITGQQEFMFDLPTVPSSGPTLDKKNVYITLGANRLYAYVLPQPPEDAEQPPAKPSTPSTPDTAPGQPKKPTQYALDEPPPIDRRGPDESINRAAYPSVMGTQEMTPSMAVMPSVVPPYRLNISSGTPSMAVMPSVVPPYRLDTGSATPSVAAVRSMRDISELALLSQRNTENRPLKVLWDYQTGLRVESAPVITSEFLMATSTERTLVVMAKPERRLIFDFNTADTITAPAGQHGETAYIATIDGAVYALNLVAGRLLWRGAGGGAIRARPIVTDTDVYVVSEKAGLSRLDRATGDTLWRTPNIQHLLAVNPKLIYGIDRTGKLVILDRNRGRILGALDTRDYTVLPANEQTDRVFLGAHNGLLLCLHDRDTPDAVPIQVVEQPQGPKGQPKKDGAAEPKMPAEEKKDQ